MVSQLVAYICKGPGPASRCLENSRHKLTDLQDGQPVLVPCVCQCIHGLTAIRLPAVLKRLIHPGAGPGPPLTPVELPGFLGCLRETGNARVEKDLSVSTWDVAFS